MQPHQTNTTGVASKTIIYDCCNFSASYTWVLLEAGWLSVEKGCVLCMVATYTRVYMVVFTQDLIINVKLLHEGWHFFYMEPCGQLPGLELRSLMSDCSMVAALTGGGMLSNFSSCPCSLVGISIQTTSFFPVWKHNFTLKTAFKRNLSISHKKVSTRIMGE